MLIEFVHQGDAYLPELQAYRDFLQSAGHGARIHRDASTVPLDARVVWWMCGVVPAGAMRRCAAALHVHEYASASVPPWAWAKDVAKRWRQPRPGYRIYQNEWVKRRLGFRDDVPFEYRDMGVAEAFLRQMPKAERVHDFVYLGEMRRLRHFLDLFTELESAGHTVLLVGDMPQDLRAFFKRLPRVTMAGRVPHADVPQWLRRARVGLNLVPRLAPFDQQTSTKLLEYCAAGLHVLTTDYPWVRAFAQRHGAKLSYLPSMPHTEGLRLCAAAAVERHGTASMPDMRALAWPEVLGRLHLWHTLGVTP